MFRTVADIATVIGKTAILTQLLKLLTLILGETPFFGDVDLKAQWFVTTVACLYYIAKEIERTNVDHMNETTAEN